MKDSRLAPRVVQNSGVELLGEKIKDAVDTLRLELLSEHRVIVPCRALKLNGDERIAKLLVQRVKASADQAIAGITQAKYLAARPSALNDGYLVVGRQSEIGTPIGSSRKRHRRLAEDRRDHDVIDHHPESKAT